MTAASCSAKLLPRSSVLRLGWRIETEGHARRLTDTAHAGERHCRHRTAPLQIRASPLQGSITCGACRNAAHGASRSPGTALRSHTLRCDPEALGERNVSA